MLLLVPHLLFLNIVCPHHPYIERDNNNDLYISCIYPEPSLRALLNELHPVRGSWYNIGLELGIPHTTLDCFKQNYSDQTDLMREVLKHWLDTAVDLPPTWETVVTALRSLIVNKKNIAAQLESKYCTLASCMKEESNSPTMVKSSEGISTYLFCDIEANLLYKERLNLTLYNALKALYFQDRQTWNPS